MSLWPTRAMRVPKMVEANLPQERHDFYVYVIFRPNGTPCYVGKGRRRRWKEHRAKSSNPRLRKLYAKYGGDLPIVKVREGLVNSEACETEIAFIAAIGREDQSAGPLVNFTDGGGGLSGLSMDIRKKIGRSLIEAYLTGRKLKSPPHPDLLIAAIAANTGRCLSVQHRAAIGRAHKGVPKTLAHIAAFTKSLTGRKLSSEHAAKIGVKQRGVPKNHGKAISAALKGVPKSQSAIAASVATKKMRYKARLSVGLGNSWWHTADGQRYMAPHSRNDRDLPGTGLPAPKNFVGSTKGTRWWHTPDFVSYRAVLVKCAFDMPGRGNNK